MERLQDLFIGIAGMIGAGKSTLATTLGAHLNLPVYFEPVQDNEYLADFYRDTPRYAFATQIYLLNRRFQQHQEIIWRGGGGVQVGRCGQLRRCREWGKECEGEAARDCCQGTPIPPPCIAL